MSCISLDGLRTLSDAANNNTNRQWESLPAEDHKVSGLRGKGQKSGEYLHVPEEQTKSTAGYATEAGIRLMVRHLYQTGLLLGLGKLQPAQRESRAEPG
ncbi:hypothetical protein INS49_005360 [Diaporthe citri]|uniref:uncharacterized protein n=1 Tax=Diaporthe citri TaxID=83186 RepID=UPI001C7EA169|nr:uncharacterized protein INS49_005360 [Diaporthe citri]KAG6353652.1 hypothetical protein INS49_005360 [Diaporthe citri]